MKIHPCQAVETRKARRAAGFTLLEFMVATVIFLVIGAAVISMFAQNAPVFNQQQNMSSLNIALQGAVAQLQLDLSNAGTGFYPGMKLPIWPTGLTIRNSVPTSACNVASTFTYTSACFDRLNILSINPNTPPTHATDSTGGTNITNNCSVTAGSPYTTWDQAGVFYILPASGLTPTQTAAGYSVGDQVLLVSSVAGTGSVNGSSTGGSMVGTNAAAINTLVLTGAPIVGANYVGLPFKTGNPTPGALVNGYPSPPQGQNNFGADDPLDISTSSTATNTGFKFCAGDWVMKLDPITYQVDATTNPQDPILTRTHIVSGTTTVDTIAEQIIGFKVGASVWGLGGITDSTALYNFYAQNQTTDTVQGYNSNFSLVRSVRVSLIGRTAPNIADPFRNTFDQGPYQVLGTDVVIDPRNVTMN